MATHTKRKRRFLRFSIRTLLIVLTIFCVALGWKVERARKQREAVAWVHEMGGSVNYDYEFDDDGSSATDAKPPGSEWLRKHLGRDFFDDVVRVSLTEVGVSDVTPLSGLTSLVELYLEGPQVSEEAVEQLKRALPKSEIKWSPSSN
jgi:hypothetical protein